MSASDKKKVRKETGDLGMTQREIKERADAAVAKKTKTIYTVVAVVCVVLAAALLIWNSGFWKKGATAATVNGEGYGAADLQYYYAQARNNEYSMMQMYMQYGIPSNYNPSLPDGAQWYNEAEGKTYADYFRETALETLKQVKALNKAAQEEGYTSSASVQDEIDATMADIDLICAQNGLTRGSYFAQVYGGQVNEKVFLRNLEEGIAASDYQEYHMNSLSYTDEELEAYYVEHTDDLDSFTYRSFFVSGNAENPVDENGEPLKDEDGNVITATEEEKQAAMDAAKAKADEAVAEILENGGSEEAFLTAAPKYVDESVRDSYAEPSYSLYEDVQGQNLPSTNGTIAPWLLEDGREIGDVAALQSSTGYYVVLYVNRVRVEDPTVNIRHILIKAELDDTAVTDEATGAQTPSQEAMDAAKAEAEALMEEFKAGEATAESFGALAMEFSEDPGSASKGGQYTFVPQGMMFPGFDEWIYDPARVPGDVGLVENPQAGQQGWHVIYFEKAEGPVWKNNATMALQQVDQSEWLEEITNSIEAVAEDGMKYVGDVNTAVPTPSAEPVESAAPAEDDAAESEVPAEDDAAAESEAPAEDDAAAESEAPAEDEAAAE